MKVKLGQLSSNPFRDIKNYPIDKQKVEQLKKSIKQTDFWDNILAREKDGKIEIAYGHHRLMALQELYDSDYEIDIPIKELDDETMIRIMANENMEYWNGNPEVIIETIRVVKKYLEGNPKIAKEFSDDYKDHIKVGVLVIANFLDWKYSLVNSYYQILQDDIGEEMEEAIKNKEIKAADAMEISTSKLPKKDKKEILDKAKKKEFRVSRDTRKYIKQKEAEREHERRVKNGEEREYDNTIIISEYTLKQLNNFLGKAVDIIENELDNVKEIYDITKLWELSANLSVICDFYQILKNRRLNGN